MTKNAYLFIQKEYTDHFYPLNYMCEKSETGLLFSKFNTVHLILSDIISINEKIINKNDIVVTDSVKDSYLESGDGVLTIIIRDNLENALDAIKECAEQEGSQVAVLHLSEPTIRNKPKIALPSNKNVEEIYLCGYFMVYGNGTVRIDNAKEYSINEISQRGCLQGVPSHSLCGDLCYYLGLTLKYGA